jgi:hypothetical protein
MRCARPEESADVKIQLLHFPDCPNAEPARGALREAMQRENVVTEIEDIDTSHCRDPVC